MSAFKPSNQIQRAFQLIETLAGHEFEPLKNSEIAKQMDIPAPEASRLLQNAQHFGWVEQTPDKLWRLAPRRFTNMSVAIQHGIQRARGRFEDEANNFTRSLI